MVRYGIRVDGTVRYTSTRYRVLYQCMVRYYVPTHSTVRYTRTWYGNLYQYIIWYGTAYEYMVRRGTPSHIGGEGGKKITANATSANTIVVTQAHKTKTKKTIKLPTVIRHVFGVFRCFFFNYRSTHRETEARPSPTPTTQTQTTQNPIP